MPGLLVVGCDVGRGEVIIGSSFALDAYFCVITYASLLQHSVRWPHRGLLN